MASKAAPTFYIFHGDDEFSRKAEVHVMRSRMGDTAELNTLVVDGRSVSAGEVMAAASVMPFLGDKRLVIVEGMLVWLTRKGGGKTAKAELDALTTGLPALPDSARLVFSESELLNENHAILKLATHEARGYVKAFTAPRDPTNWIVKQVQAYGGTIEPRAASALAAVVGPDLRAADSECTKLVLYVGVDRAITEADVAVMTSYVAEVRIFDMVDALGKRDSKTAARLMRRLLEDQDPMSLLPMIYRQFRLLIQAREALDAGGDRRQLMKLPDFRSEFVAGKAIEQARNFSIEQLEDIYRYLLEMDHSIKTGQVTDELALDLLVAGLGS